MYEIQDYKDRIILGTAALALYFVISDVYLVKRIEKEIKESRVKSNLEELTGVSGKITF